MMQAGTVERELDSVCLTGVEGVACARFRLEAGLRMACHLIQHLEASGQVATILPRPRLAQRVFDRIL